MKTYIALFRGINVGGRNILPMKDLIKILENLDCSQVKTYIQSGNVVFNTKENNRNILAEKISRGIEERFQFKPKVLLLEAADLELAIKNNPFDTENGKVLHFSFLETLPTALDLEGLIELKTDSEEFKFHNNIFYLYAPDGIGRSKLAAKVEQKLGVEVTARNWNTVNKLFEMVKQV
jgi:uncharacterized protein (DUF1697 family)